MWLPTRGNIRDYIKFLINYEYKDVIFAYFRKALEDHIIELDSNKSYILILPEELPEEAVKEALKPFRDRVHMVVMQANDVRLLEIS